MLMGAKDPMARSALGRETVGTLFIIVVATAEVSTEVPHRIDRIWDNGTATGNDNGHLTFRNNEEAPPLRHVISNFPVTADLKLLVKNTLTVGND